MQGVEQKKAVKFDKNLSPNKFQKFIGWFRNFNNNIWIVTFIFIVFIVIALFIWGFSTLPSDKTQLHYLLSALGQTLGAIFALVFTISLVTAQLITKYTQHVIRMAFPSWLIYYLIFFVCAIIYPFFLLNRDYGLFEVQISISFGVICIFLLVPYFFVFSSRFDIENIVDKLAKKANKKYLRDADRGGRYEMIAISDIAVRALASGDYDTFKLAIRSFFKVFLIKNLSIQPAAFRDSLDRLKLIYSRENIDSVALEQIAEFVNDLTFLGWTQTILEKSHKEGSNEIHFPEIQLLYMIQDIGIIAIKNNEEGMLNSIDLVLKSLRSIMRIVTSIKSNFEVETCLSVTSMIAQEASRNNHPSMTNIIVNMLYLGTLTYQLREIKLNEYAYERILELGKEDVLLNSNTYFGISALLEDDQPYFEEFINDYKFWKKHKGEMFKNKVTKKKDI